MASRSRSRLSRWLPGLLILGGPVLAVTAGAQTPDAAQTIQALRREVAAQRRLLNDWAGLTRYGSENTELPAPAAGQDRVVFLGDEITERWGQTGGQTGGQAGGQTGGPGAGQAAGRAAGGFFPGKPYLNRGISGQTTPQMLVRFRQDVISLKPKAVVILAGANDLAGVAGPATEGTMAENFMSMVELAKANGIRVVLASVTPVCDCFSNQTGVIQTKLRPQGKIISLNGWLRDYAAKSGSVYLNYYSALADGRDFKKDLTMDGLLPNDAGYAVMAPLAEQAIAQALGRK